MTIQSILGLIALILCILHPLVRQAPPLWLAVLLLALAVALPGLRGR